MSGAGAWIHSLAEEFFSNHTGYCNDVMHCRVAFCLTERILLNCCARVFVS